VYSRYGGIQEATKIEDTILLEETVAMRDYSVLLPVANEVMARQLANFGALFALANRGELFALNVIRVPAQLGVTDGRAFLRRSRPLLDEVVAVGREFNVPVRTMLRLGRDISDSILSAAQEREANLMILGWPGQTRHRDQAFGTIIDLMAQNPPCDLAVVRFRRSSAPMQKILVPVAGGPNTRMALELAVTQADALEQVTGQRPTVVALNLALGESPTAEQMDRQRQQLIDQFELAELPIEIEVTHAQDVVEGILAAAVNCDQIVIGASEERLLEQSLFGSIPQRVAEEAPVTTVMVKRHDMVKFGLRRWLFARKR
ncbi:MAG: universal stress protein, partial [Caldilineaceae bacterium]|nr:universal stress protein [Caldilineaceae bacterium]